MIKQFKPLALAAALALGAHGLAQAQNFPTKPIKIVVPWAPGGATDVIARVLGQKLGERLGQPVIVENKAGAGGNIGTAAFIREAADGHTLLMGTSSTNAINPSLYKDLPFDPVKDFTPIMLVATVPNVLVVPAHSRFNSVDELVKAAKAEPGKISYGSGGNGSSQHIAAAIFTKVTGSNLMHVPYKGSGPAAADLMAGHIALMFDTGSVGHIKGQKLKALAVASSQRVPALPDVKTFEELGYKGVQAAAWYGFYAPAKTPANVADRLNKELNAVLQDAEVKKRLNDYGAIVNGGAREEFARFTGAEIERYRKIIQDAKIAIE
ncbi:MAG: tripartite tricarboxylate transporter substrate binding protein [Comamonas sp.]|uniref:Bug family tripartite tricarboxylate transporter substrate binding protein n=1 Tax=Comamonas sp. TaxID=34028 RepID=UPI002FC9566F